MVATLAKTRDPRALGGPAGGLSFVGGLAAVLSERGWRMRLRPARACARAASTRIRRRGAATARAALDNRWLELTIGATPW